MGLAMLKSTSHPLAEDRCCYRLCYVGGCDECKDVLDADEEGASGPLA